MKELIHQLENANVGKVSENEPLAKHTTLKIGGPADILVEPDSIDDLKTVISIVKENDVKWTAIGRGSNLLVSDNGIEGVVIKLGKGLDHLEENESEIRVGGGYSLVKLSTIMSRKGMAGLEFASGIPGSVGGAVYMNAGAHGSDMSNILKKAHILFDDGTMEWLSCDEMAFSYRTSILQSKPGIVLEAVLQLQEGNRDEITAVMQKNKDYRKETQPWNHPCCGSVFRNPLPNYAGQLIESSGLKGKTIGGAQISDMHANFIVNIGDAKAQDVLDLIDLVKATIKEKHNINMETEVEMIGR
ncbi:UDP-N-acetylmuramate dehydrogenase [Pseudalkalibacillus sp. SCS-8]|uniref:UDP-N-acetylmuramate dehydrogenase n=1 Tax=Pseudalkalibacillus nanhaiensis TaxID=3115291 RepID=UPI0032DAA003